MNTNTPPLIRDDPEWSDEFEVAHKFGVTFNLISGETGMKFIDTRSLSFAQKCTVIVSMKRAKLARNFANLAKEFGWFESVSEARKAGWNKSVEEAFEHRVGKRKIVINEG